jgi:hypothetical protein
MIAEETYQLTVCLPRDSGKIQILVMCHLHNLVSSILFGPSNADIHMEIGQSSRSYS